MEKNPEEERGNSGGLHDLFLYALMVASIMQLLIAIIS
jgi:hypothetical protein